MFFFSVMLPFLIMHQVAQQIDRAIFDLKFILNLCLAFYLKIYKWCAEPLRKKLDGSLVFTLYLVLCKVVLAIYALLP